MKIVSQHQEITFDDVLLLPNFSGFTIENEQKRISLKTKLTKKLLLDVPIVSAPMPGVTESAMAIALAQAGGLGFIHHFQSFQRQLEQVSKVKERCLRVAACVGDFSESGIQHVENLLKLGADLISVESAHAHNAQTIQFIETIKKKFDKIQISVSLVVDQDATHALIHAGADSIRVGIGGGSHCTTRLVTGVGRPQLSAILDCVKITNKYNIPLISDTGIKYPGDIAKAIAFGADTVMIGGLLSGTDECPGEIISKNGKKYKYSWGMCTDTAMRQIQLDSDSFIKRIKTTLRYSLNKIRHNNRDDQKLFEEGVEGLVPYKYSVRDVIRELIAGLRRSMWYQGAHSLKELRLGARVVLVSQNTILENNPRI